MAPSSLLLIRGLVGVAIGILAVAWPGLTIAVLVSVFGLYAILDGITNLVLGLTRSHGQGRSWAHALQGCRRHPGWWSHVPVARRNPSPCCASSARGRS